MPQRGSTTCTCIPVGSLLSERMADVHVEMHFEMKSLCSYFKHFAREVHVKTIADGLNVVRGSVHHSTIHKEKSNKMLQCIFFYYSIFI
jgi:hypothetical protein